jgi:hypothetical protein
MAMLKVKPPGLRGLEASWASGSHLTLWNKENISALTWSRIPKVQHVARHYIDRAVVKCKTKKGLKGAELYSYAMTEEG